MEEKIMMINNITEEIIRFNLISLNPNLSIEIGEGYFNFNKEELQYVIRSHTRNKNHGDDEPNSIDWVIDVYGDIKGDSIEKMGQDFDKVREYIVNALDARTEAANAEMD